MPTSTAVPPTGSAAMASSAVDGRPIASNTKSGPPSVRSRRAPSVAAASSSARSVSVAPTARATSSLSGMRSMATIRDAPATAAPITHDSPTPPSPMTATVAPAGTAAVLSTAPTPVVTQQPMSAATAGSVPSGTGIAAAAGTTLASAIVAIAQYEPGAVAERGLAVEQGVPVRRGVGAGPHVPAPARATHAARDEPRQRDELADAGRRHALPDGLDDARPLVAHDDRRRAIPLAVADMEVGVAHARGEHPHADLARPRLAQLELADDDRLPRPPRGRRHGPGSRHDWSRLAHPAALVGVDRQVRDVVGPPHRGIDVGGVRRPRRPRRRSSATRNGVLPRAGTGRRWPAARR